MSNTHTNHVTSSTTLTTTTETVAAIVSNFQTDNPLGEGVAIDGSAVVVTGTGTTSLTIKVYVAGSTAPVVGSAVPGGATQVGGTITQTVTAGNTVTVPIGALDTSAAALISGAAGLTYFATVKQNAASANGSVSYAILSANSSTISE